MVTKETTDLLEKLDKKISDFTFAGWRIVDKNEKRVECVLEKGGDYSWGLHLFLTLITVFWGIVWYFQYKKNKLRRMRISYDNSGNYREERVG
tara:strand:+ start:399 stop:677 length:279 start_codon:yes stop_codon:yes gene_type:complete